MKNSVRLTRLLMTATGLRLTLWLGLCGCVGLSFCWAGNGFGLRQSVRAAAALAPVVTVRDKQPRTGRKSGQQAQEQPAHDDISPEQRAQIEREIAAYYAKLGAARAPAAPQMTLQKFPFYPIGGTLWQDLNSSFIDLNPAAGVITTYECGQRTYDGHTGHDIGFGRFYEMGVGNQNFGIPIFAALDGVVVAMHDGEFDQVTSCDVNNQPVANYVVLDHGNGQRTVYFHFKKNSIRVNVGDTVFAGKQLGWVGSSGCSSAPHLHFEPQMLNPNNGQYERYEPFSGSCNQVASGWVNQTPLEIPATISVRDLWFSSTTNSDFEVDTRTGTYVMSAQAQGVRFRMAFSNFPDGSNGRTFITIKAPNGTNIINRSAGSFGPSYGGNYAADLGVTLNQTGIWRWIIELGNGQGGFQTLVDAPFTVVGTPGEVVNHPPNPVTVSLDPPTPKTNDVIFCRVNTVPSLRDPDYDRVKYRYVWQVNGVTKRDVTTPVLSDALERGLTAANGNVTCTVTPSDDTVAAAATMASATTTCPVLTLSPASLPNGIVNIGYNQTLTASGGTANTVNPYTFSLSAGTLPTGLSLLANGLLSGTPSAPGTFNFTIKATDKVGCMGTQAYTVTIAQPCLSLTVNSLGDTPDANPGNLICADSGGNCTLRAALMEANANTTCAGSPIPINFSVTGTITLGSALPTIAYANLSLNGPGANQLTVSGNNAVRVFNIGSGAFNVNFSGLTIANGRVTSGGDAQGGGIFNASTGTVNVINCTLSNNTIVNTGGGTGFGGGIFHNSIGMLNVMGSTLVGNSATGGVHGWGGGICNGSTGTVSVTNSTLSGNSALANPGGQFRARGGALANVVNGTVNVTNSTITGNSSTDLGGGIVNGITVLTAGTVVNIKNSIVAGNTAPAGGPDVYSGATFTSLGFNLIGKVDGSSGFSPPNDQTGTIAAPLDPKLAPLGNYGGPTRTHLLLANSPARNAGTVAGAPANDQRGYPRPLGAAVDIGAVEDDVSLTINPAVLPNGQIGQPYSQQLSQTGGATGTSVWTISAGNLPGNVVLNAATGLLSGTPTGSGTFTFTIIVTSANGLAGIRDYALVVTPAGCPTITVNPSNPTLSAGTTTVPYSRTFTQTGGTGTITWDNPGGGLPPGLTLAVGTGTLSGTPTTPGAYSFIIRATDANNCTGQRQYTLVINSAACAVTTPISIGQTINGALTNTDCDSTGPYADFYSFNASAGQQVYVSLLTTSFNAYLMLTGPNGFFADNAGGGGGMSARIPAGSGLVTLPETGTYTITATSLFLGETGNYSLTLGTSGNGLQFFPLAAPVRLLDTRPGASANACSQPNAPIAGQTSRTQPGRNLCTIPANARALTGNVTTVQSGGGFLTLYPSNAAQPTVASTNYGVNEIINNVFTVGLGADGAFKIFANNTTDVVVDVTGYYAPPATGGLYFHPLPAPVRLLETRAGLPVGCVKPGVPLTGMADSTQQAISACTGIPAAARAIVGNATTVDPQGGGFLTLFPGDALRPLVASSNYNFGQVVNGPFSVGLAANGQFKIYTHFTTHLVVDVLGYYSPEANDANGAGLLFYTLFRPVRLLETRPGLPVGCFKPGAPLAGGTDTVQTARGLCDGATVPNNALGVVGNATVVFPSGAGFLTLYPSTAARPLVATSNFNAGDVGNRHFIVGLGNADGAFKIYTHVTSHLVIDLSGYFAP